MTKKKNGKKTIMAMESIFY